MRKIQIILLILLTFSVFKVEAAKEIGLQILTAKMAPYSSTRVFLKIRFFNYANDTIILRYRMLNSLMNDIFWVKIADIRVDTARVNGYLAFSNISFDYGNSFSPFYHTDDREATEEKRFLTTNESLEQIDDSGFHIYKIAPKAYLDLNMIIGIDRLGLTYIPYTITPKQKAKLSAELALKITYKVRGKERYEWVNSGRSEKLKNALITW